MEGNPPRIMFFCKTMGEAQALKMLLEDKMPLEEFLIKESK